MAKTHLTPPKFTEQDIRRFWNKVDRTPGQGPDGTCWRWKWRNVNPNRSPKIYSTFKVDGSNHNSHRIAFYLANGVWCAQDTCHSCDIRDCCNPAHLWDGTRAENLADMAKKKRHAVHSRPDWGSWARPVHLRGTANGSAKLTDDDVREIRAITFWPYGMGVRVAARYGVTTNLVWMIRARKIWTHI